jgi:hypothetical protein
VGEDGGDKGDEEKVKFLAQKYTQPQEAEQTPQQRVPDLNKGEIWMSDDFNDPLPNESYF